MKNKHIKMKSKYFHQLYENHNFSKVKQDFSHEEVEAFTVQYKGSDNEVTIFIDDTIQGDYEIMGDF